MENTVLCSHAVTLIQSFRYKGFAPAQQSFSHVELCEGVPYNFAADRYHTKKCCIRHRRNSANWAEEMSEEPFLAAIKCR